MTSSNVKKLEVTETKMCIWACSHTLRAYVRNDDIGETLTVENHRDVQESKTDVVWPRKEGRPRLRRKKHWRWFHLGEEKEEDRIREGRTVPTDT